MSSGVLRRAAWTAIAELPGGAPLKRALWTVIRQCHDEQLQFFYDAGADAGLESPVIRARGTATAFLASAIQLADDLSDGDARYLKRSGVEGPVLLMLLDQLFFAAALKAETPTDVLLHCSRTLGSVGSGQHLELRTSRWTRCRAATAARALNGAQQSAYLELLWWGTTLSSRAERVGLDLGFSIHVATDIHAGDRRFESLSLSDRRTLVEDVRQSCRRLMEHEIPCVTRLAHAVLASLPQSLR